MIGVLIFHLNKPAVLTVSHIHTVVLKSLHHIAEYT